MPTQPMNVGIRYDQQAEQRRRRNIGTVQRLVMNSSTRRFERRTNSASQRTEAMCKIRKWSGLATSVDHSYTAC
jgi:hypothetical protein